MHFFQPLALKITFIFVCVFALHGLPSVAAARSNKAAASTNDATAPDSDDAKAKMLFRSALEHYASGNYPLALKELLAAKDLKPRKSIQHNIAKTYLVMGEKELARQAYMDLIHTYGNGNGLLSEQELTSQERDEAEEEIANACRGLVDSAQYRNALSALMAARQTVTGKAAKSIALSSGRTYEALGDDVAALRIYGELLGANGRSSDTKLRLTEKEKSEISAAFERVRRRTATIKGRIRPMDVAIRIGDPKLGTAHAETVDPNAFEQGLRRKIGKLTLEFSKSGYQTETRTVELLPDETQRIDITLQPASTETVASGSPFPPAPAGLPYSPHPSPISAPPPTTGAAATSAQPLPYSPYAAYAPHRFTPTGDGAVEHDDGGVAIGDSTVHNHDGFYLRFALGVGYAFDSLHGTDSSGSDMGGIGIRSVCVPFDIAIGGAVGPVVVGGLMSAAFLTGPTYSNASSYERANYQHGYIFVGPFVDYYLNPHLGTHLGAAIGIGGPTVSPPSGEDQGNTNNDPGFGATLMAGHDFWISNQWSLGALVRALYVRGPDEYGASHSAIISAVLFSALWN